MKVAVVGAGALGCLFGGRLADAGHDVRLVHHRPEYVDRLNDRGLTIVHEDGRTLAVDVRATTDASEGGPADLVLVFVKSHHTAAALEEHAGCIGGSTAVLSLQNGLRHYERLIEFVGEERAFAGTTYQGATVEEPGVVHVDSTGPSTFGGVDEAGARRIETALEGAGFPVERVDDPRPHIWAKQLVSLPIKPLAALTHLPNGRLAELEETRGLMAAVVAEAEAVVDHRGIDLPMDDPMAEVLAACERSRNHYSSMLQDVRAERKTEIDDVNGAIVEFAREDGLEAPVNELLTRLVRAKERSYLEE